MPKTGYYSNPTATDDWPDDEDMKRAHVRSANGRWFCKGWAETILTNENADEPTTFHGHIDQLGETERYMMQRIEFTEDDIEGLADNLKQGTV